VLGARPVDAKIVVRTPVSDPDADVRLVGSVDLADVARTVKLDGVKALSGVVTADVATRARVSDVDARRYDRVSAAGTIQASQVAVQPSTSGHSILIDRAGLTLTPQTAQLTQFNGKVGSSDVQASGTLDNLLGFVLRNEDLRGHAQVTSSRFVLDEWKSDDKTTEVIPVPPRVDFTLNTSAAQVAYGPLTFADVKGTLEVKNERVSIRNLTMGMLKGTVVANGYYETVDVAKPSFSMDVKLTTLDIPTAFTSLLTVQKLAPIARYAQGNVSGTVSLSGPIARDMTPVFTALTGKGEIGTERLVLQGAPVMEKLSSALSLNQLANPGIGAVKASFDVADGRVHVKPMTVKVAGIDLTASGSNGVDQSIQYDLALAVPRALLGPAATSAISKLASTAGKLGAELPAGEVVQLLAKVTGTVANPTVTTNFTGMAASARDAAQNAAKQMAAAATETVKQKVDSTVDVARARAKAEADRIIADAQRQADTIRAVARAAADKLKADANARIDSLVAKATNPIAKIAAQKAADQLRNQTNQQAEKVIQDANARADAIVAQAKQKAETLAPPGAP
jgi:vacuolar-type H+-ATPase subunit H